MPKSKKDDTDSDSDSGPDDRQPAKKSKTDSVGRSGSTTNKTNEEGDPYWDVGTRKRITVRSYKGTVYVDIREYYEKDGKTLPGKKGIALNRTDWGMLRALTDEIEEIVKYK